MRILHYTLGFAPYRSGGLTRYAHDLMVAEIELGNEVTALFPGNARLLHRKTQIRKEANIDNIVVYELRNPLPVPLLYGLPQSGCMIDDSVLDETDVNRFLDAVQPEVFHIQTLMGLPRKLIWIIKERGVKVVYTTHDYFGLCPKVNFIDNAGNLCDGASPQRCERCNEKAKNVAFLRFRNSKWIVPMKDVLRKYFK